MTADLPPDLLTTAEVAARFGVHIETVRRWAVSGELPVAMKLPGATGDRLFARKDVEAFETLFIT